MVSKIRRTLIFSRLSIMKLKRHIVLPAALIIYAIAMAIIGYTNYRQSGNMSEFWLIIGASLAVSVLLYFVLKRRENRREKRK